MDEKKRKRLAMDAHMEGQQTIVAGIGRRVKVSEMELICLVNFAEIGLMSMFAATDGATGEMAERDLEKTMNAVRNAFAKDGKGDGLSRLSQSTAALLRSPKFQCYLAR